MVRIQPNHDLRGVAPPSNVRVPIILFAEIKVLNVCHFGQVPLLFFVLCGNSRLYCSCGSHADKVMKIGKTSAVIGPFVSEAIISASGNNNNMPFTFLFGL